MTRNRLRRRLRAILCAIDHEQALPPVMILIGATPRASAMSFVDLQRTIEQMIHEIRTAPTTRTVMTTRTDGNPTPLTEPNG